MSNDFSGPQMIASMIVRAIGQPFTGPLSVLATQNLRAEDATSSAVLINVFRSIEAQWDRHFIDLFYDTYLFSSDRS